MLQIACEENLNNDKTSKGNNGNMYASDDASVSIFLTFYLLSYTDI